MTDVKNNDMAKVVSMTQFEFQLELDKARLEQKAIDDDHLRKVKEMVVDSADKLYEEQISKSALKKYLETKRKDILAVGDEPRALRAEIAVLDEMIGDLIANNIK